MKHLHWNDEAAHPAQRGPGGTGGTGGTRWHVPARVLLHNNRIDK
jgi:hypothetical protein